MHHRTTRVDKADKIGKLLLNMIVYKIIMEQKSKHTSWNEILDENNQPQAAQLVWGYGCTILDPSWKEFGH